MASGRKAPDSANATTVALEAEPANVAGATALATPDVGHVTPELRAQCVWTDDMVAAAGIPVFDVPFVTVGGGLGSFAMVNALRVAGVKKEDIAVLTPLDTPYETFKFYADVSQMGDAGLLRSDSGSRIDSLWGFPGYALQEARRRKSLGPLGRVLVEPVLAEHYNPRCHQVYEGLRREAARIGWASMLVKGRVDVVRRRDGGDYFAVLTPPSDATPAPQVAFRSRYVHVAIGHPALRVLPEVLEYRARYDDGHRMVHAYEEHSHVYEALKRQPGTVLVRGAGIAAPRILERLVDDRDRHGAQTRIVQLFRNYAIIPEGPPWFRRPAGNGYTYQPFNFPKGAFGGQVAKKVESLDPQERAAFLQSIGGTSTPRRRLWQEQLQRGLRRGWYQYLVGEIDDAAPSGTGRVRTTIRSPFGALRTVNADYVIDATGLDPDVRIHGVLSDMIDCDGAELNALGRIDVDEHFEVKGARSDSGRIYASGAITLGGPVAPVDSFFGLSQAALEICDELARQGFCRRIGSWRSVKGWWGWVRNTPV